MKRNTVKKRYCKNCDGVNLGGYYDDICIIQLSKDYHQYLFDDGGDNYGCQVPAKVWKEAVYKYGDFGCEFNICDKLIKENNK